MNRLEIHWGMVGRVVAKGLVLFALVNLAFVLVDPFPLINRLNGYGAIFPLRERLPYAENPSEAYNVTITDLDRLFAVHALQQNKAPDEYRVLLLGDSGVWGWLLEPHETLSACLNREALPIGERSLQAYNLGYPVLNVTKDLLLLEQGLAYDVDLVVWFVTLAALYADEQTLHEIVQQNPDSVRRLSDTYNLNLPDLPVPLTGWNAVWDSTMIGQRKELAAWLQLQTYGVAWWATGIDHRAPDFVRPVQQNQRESPGMLDGTAEEFWQDSDLSLDVLIAGVQMAGDVPVLFVNEPIYRTTGLNSDIHYNFYYPRWAYDRYRVLMGEWVAAQGWHYLDVWDAFPPQVFTDSSLHMTPEATCQLAALVGQEILQIAP